MIKRLQRWVFVLLLATSYAAAAALNAETSPETLVQTKTAQILQLIEHNRSTYIHDRASLYAMVNTQIVPYFDFRRMSRWVLARYWRTASAEERRQFTTQFTGLLVRTYATALLSYSGQRIQYLPFRMNPGSRHATVETAVIQNNGAANIPIDYEFVHGKDGWKVYDVTIDGVSLVTNYRSVYADKIRRDGLPALIASMARVNRENP